MKNMKKENLNSLYNKYLKLKENRNVSNAEKERFYNELSIAISYDSNAIEGNTFTYDETRLLIKEGVTTNLRSFREHQEIIGHKNAFDFIYNSVKNKELILDLNFIKKIHKLVLSQNEEAGKIRKSKVFIGNPFDIKYKPTEPENVENELQILIDVINKTMNFYKQKNFDYTEKDIDNIFTEIAQHHIEFEMIHPFIDGNGRVGRLILNLELINLGFIPIDIKNEEKSEYYKGFTEYQKNNNINLMKNIVITNEERSLSLWIENFN